MGGADHFVFVRRGGGCGKNVTRPLSPVLSEFWTLQRRSTSTTESLFLFLFLKTQKALPICPLFHRRRAQ